MRFFIAPRRAGKTSFLTRWHWECVVPHRRVLIVADIRRAKELQRQPGGEELLLGRDILTLQQVLSGALRGRTQDTELAVDDLDHLLPQLLGTSLPIRWVTATEE